MCVCMCRETGEYGDSETGVCVYVCVCVHFLGERAHNFYNILKGVHDSENTLKTIVLDLKITKRESFKK